LRWWRPRVRGDFGEDVRRAWLEPKDDFRATTEPVMNKSQGEWESTDRG